MFSFFPADPKDNKINWGIDRVFMFISQKFGKKHELDKQVSLSDFFKNSKEFQGNSKEFQENAKQFKTNPRFKPNLNSFGHSKEIKETESGFGRKMRHI